MTKRWRRALERARRILSFYDDPNPCCGSPGCPFGWSHIGNRMVCHQDLAPIHETAASLALDGMPSRLSKQDSGASRGQPRKGRE